MSEPVDQTTDNEADQAAQLPPAEENTNAAPEGSSIPYMVSIGDQTYSVRARNAEEAGDKAKKLAAKETK